MKTARNDSEKPNAQGETRSRLKAVLRVSPGASPSESGSENPSRLALKAADCRNVVRVERALPITPAGGTPAVIGKRGEVRPRLYSEALDIVTSTQLENAREKKQLELEFDRARTRMANTITRLETRIEKARRHLREVLDESAALEKQVAALKAQLANADLALDGRKHRIRD